MIFSQMDARLDLRFPLFFAAVLFLAGCGAEATSPPPADSSAPPVQVAEATARTAPIPLRTSGRLASKAEIQLAFKIDGVIDRILVDEGDRVQKGAVLARLNLAEINAQVAEAKSGLEKAQRDLERTRRLHRDSVATLEELQDARTAVEVAEARLQAAQFNRQYAVIEAPESGRILRRRAEEGEYVGPGRPVLTLGAVGRGWVVRAGLSSSDVVRVALGDTAHVTFDAHPDRPVTGRVTEIADAADPRTGTFEVELSVPDDDLSLKSGFIGRVTLFPSGGPSTVEIPAEALISGSGRQGVVYRFDDSTQTVRRQTVAVRQILDSTVVLASGLRAGVPVVTTGGRRLTDGDSVRVVDD
jgi:RND family efflux transporter MFP subunit